MVYLDTSVLVAALSNEPLTATVQSWFGHQASNELWISDWTITEISSALALKVRMKHLNPAQRSVALRLFATMTSENLLVSPVTRKSFQLAARLVDQSDRGLRAGDAVHLAIATELGSPVCTLDAKMAEAATELGISIIVIE